MIEKDVLIAARNLSKDYISGKTFSGKPRGYVHAVEDVSLDIYKGETLGIVGESGCGKSTLARLLLRLIEPTSGVILYRGENLLMLDRESMRKKRRFLQLVFQDPYAALNSKMTVISIIKEPLDIFRIGTKEERYGFALEMMRLVGLRESDKDSYPDRLSGGQRQRVAIARALILHPEFVVCDEPVSALDASVRAQILRLLMKLQKDRSLTYLFISHDLSVVRCISDRIVVMYLGRVVEISDKNELFTFPMHPYTKALVSMIPGIEAGERKTARLEGEIPNPVNRPSGCYFHTRCPYADDKCKRELPSLKEILPGHWCACHKAAAPWKNFY